MNKPWLNLAAAALVGISVLIAGWLIRDGLVRVSDRVQDVSTELRDKPFPQKIGLTLGDPSVDLRIGAVDMQHTPANSGRITIENLLIDIPSTQPTK